MNGDVAAGGAHRDRHVTCRQGRGIVDTVADHRHLMAGGLERVDHFELLVWQHLGLIVIEVHLPRDPPGDTRAVAGEEHESGDAHALEPVDGACRLRPGVVLEADPADQSAVVHDVEHREAVGLWRGLHGFEGGQVDRVWCRHCLGQPRAAADQHGVAVGEHRNHAAAWHLLKRAGLGQRDPRPPAHLRDRAGHRMATVLLGCRRQSQEVLRRDTICGRKP